ncbi:protein Jade-1 isoform X6 [Dermochelys coriacea]|uniref:protein Jade-1 isoform X6 n=1 Tax=Dermochelys coriacea TaxID=27794 RepID=UPI0018E76584|nr:protein Jade-1 isoform X6 [Dermochelys coriacea]
MGTWGGSVGLSYFATDPFSFSRVQAYSSSCWRASCNSLDGHVLGECHQLFPVEIMKRGRLPSSSEDSDDNGSLSTWSQHSRSRHRRNSCSRHEDRKPSELIPSNLSSGREFSCYHSHCQHQVFRTDLITAMKLPDSYQLNPDEYYVLADPWRQEWEKGVQVPVSPGAIPEPVARVVSETKAVTFTRPRKYILSSGSEPPELGYVDIRTLADSVCRYDLNDVDAAWLELANEEFKEMGMPELDEYTMERVMEEFEQRCYDSMNHAIETEEGLGIEYDEDVVCDVCQSPDGEDGNEMVFCDKCNICVHQACYGILKVPEGSWLCRTCALGVQPKCLLCPKKGGAMKPTRSGTKWVHVSCALWIPEVSIGSPEKMEPITKVSHIPSSRWALVCSLCNEKIGASIQVRNLTYMVTRREKIKRSVCKVQEQIFNLYTKLMEQERVSGVPSSSFSVENVVLFNSPSLGPDAPKIEDLKWHSAFFRKQMGTSLTHTLKKPHKRDRARNSSGSDSKSLLKQPSRRESVATPGSFLNFEKAFAEARIVSAQQRNGIVMTDHRKRRDSRSPYEVIKAELKEKPCKHSHKPLTSTEVSQRQSENKRSVNHPGGRSAPGTRRDIVPKCNGSLIKINYNRPVVKVPTTPTSPVKNWGGFRIPKKGERQHQGEIQEETCHQNSNYPYLGMGRVLPKDRAKSKLKTDRENDGYAPDAEMSDSETEVAETKCRQQRLSPNSTINRRTDIIRRSILAS